MAGANRTLNILCWYFHINDRCIAISRHILQCVYVSEHWRRHKIQQLIGLHIHDYVNVARALTIFPALSRISITVSIIKLSLTFQFFIWIFSAFWIIHVLCHSFKGLVSLRLLHGNSIVPKVEAERSLPIFFQYRQKKAKVFCRMTQALSTASGQLIVGSSSFN